MKSLKDRFDEKYTVDPVSGCWLWTASLQYTGYGNIAVNGKRTYAHRWSYEYHVGPIPEGMQIDHLCRIRRCVNPKHLEAVTPRENVVRGEAGTSTVLFKLSEEHVAEVRKDTRLLREISAEYGISKSEVSRIRRGLRRA